MKKMKRLFVSLFATALVLTSVTAFAEETETAAETTTELAAEASADTAQTTASTEVEADDDVSASDAQSLATYAQQCIEMITSMTDAQLEEIINPSTLLSVPQKSVVSGVESWMSKREKLGAYVGVKKHTISVSDDSITISTVCEFANMEGLVNTTLDKDELSMDSITFAENTSSLAKSMQEAALNTVMGLGVVFLVLFFLSFLIGQFKHISNLENSMKKGEKAAAPAPAPAAQAPVFAQTEEEPENADNGALIAVIAAAIAAAEGTAADGFVVRTIKKSKRNNWQRA